MHNLLRPSTPRQIATRKGLRDRPTEEIQPLYPPSIRTIRG